jgi:hypothetical protein
MAGNRPGIVAGRRVGEVTEGTEDTATEGTEGTGQDQHEGTKTQKEDARLAPDRIPTSASGGSRIPDPGSRLNYAVAPTPCCRQAKMSR